MADLPAGPTLITAAVTQEVSVLALHQLLDHQPGHRLHQRRDDVGLPVDPTSQRPVQLLTCQHRRSYPSHWPAPLVGPEHPT